jgi:23S rRNA (uracil1939-C5)-methyltransferase
VKKEKKRIVLENIIVTDYAAEGKALAKIDGKVIFISGAVPGDVVDIFLTKNKKDWAEARVIEIKQPSTERQLPFCKHFGLCGGCKWQMLPYAKQLQYKQQEVEQNLKRIGKVDLPELMPIIGADDDKHYRNKLEFTFSNKRYLLPEEMATEETTLQSNALGFHVPRLFDKIIDIQECFLMDDVNNSIRNTVRDFALLHNFTFYDVRQHTGWLRNIVIRYCTTGELMVNIIFNTEDEENRKLLLDDLLLKVPSISTLLYTINPKFNDTIYDLTPVTYFGKGYAIEKLENFSFKISPKSFFQTNTKQAEKLYQITRDFAGLTGNEVVYDLYCGTGSIGIFLSQGAKKIIGVEAIEDAIEDAIENAALNAINHTHFFAGDVIKICNDEFFATHGKPDVVITDPPRAGMHEKLVNKLLNIEAPKIVYVSCNTATQARDIGLLNEKYSVQKIQPVDMFPHTHHIECVVLLVLREVSH